MIPKVKIDGIELTENDYYNHGKVWNCLKLIEESKKYKVFDLPLIGIDLSSTPWPNKSIDSIIYHFKRVQKTNLKYPIILDSYGCIADGWHRVVKAVLEGKPTIKAIRLETMPEADKILNND